MWRVAIDESPMSRQFMSAVSLIERRFLRGRFARPALRAGCNMSRTDPARKHAKRSGGRLFVDPIKPIDVWFLSPEQ